MHWHTHTETVVVLEGAVDIVMDGTRYTATAGSYVIIPGKAHHARFTHPDADAVNARFGLLLPAQTPNAPVRARYRSLIVMLGSPLGASSGQRAVTVFVSV